MQYGARRPGCTSVQVHGDPNAPHQVAGAARAPCVTLRTGGRDNHWSIKSVGRTRPQNILLMEPVSNPSCLVWQPGRGRPTRPLSREPNNPYLNSTRGPRASESADLPGCKVYSPKINASCLSTEQARHKAVVLFSARRWRNSLL